MNKLIAVLIAVFAVIFTGQLQAQILSESFDSTLYPPTGWTNTHIAGAANPGTWVRVSSGTNPTCTPHSGAGMAYYNSYSWSGGNAGDLATPALNFSSGSFAVSFWMYRDTGAATKYDSVAVYVDINTSSAGGARIGLVNRCKSLAPVESTQGWHKYTFNIPSNYNGASNHIIFKGTSDFGNRMFIDDVSVFSLTPPSDLTGISATDSSVCQSSTVTLHAGGIDGTVYWYADSCGGTLLGTGDSIAVTPVQTTTYYARNYKNNLFSTNCASLAVSVNPNYHISISDTICASTTYTLVNGTVVDTSGLYVVTLPTVSGCDSTITLSLVVLPQASSIINAAICSGQTYLFNGVNLSQSGTYYDTLQTTRGCDSIITLNLTVANQINSSVQQSICSGDSVLFNGVYITQAGSYNDTLPSIGGCDTVVTLQLSVLPTLSRSIDVQICNGTSYDFNGTLLNQSGTYYDTLTASTGCDSAVTLNLLVINQLTSTISQIICYGDSFLLHGNYYSQSGTYVDTLVAAAGCDSIVTLQLLVSNQLLTTLTQSICLGDSIIYNGVYYTQPTSIIDTLIASTGCDSIVTFNLTVNTIDTPTITQNGFELHTQTYASYQWQLNGADIPSANDSIYVAGSNGDYSVIVTDSNGCHATSAILGVTGVGIDQIGERPISIYPNPASDIVSITNLPAQMSHIEIFNSFGQMVMAGNIRDGKIDIATLPKGCYLLSIHVKDSIKRVKFVKQ